jgi:hypothetical protein
MFVCVGVYGVVCVFVFACRWMGGRVSGCQQN